MIHFYNQNYAIKFRHHVFSVGDWNDFFIHLHTLFYQLITKSENGKDSTNTC